MKRQIGQFWRIVLSLPLALLAGCSLDGRTSTRWSGPATPVSVSIDEWPAREQGKVLKTAHYHIYTTIDDPIVLRRLPQVLEGAYAQYQRFAAAPVNNARPMKCYVFSRRREWAEFTSKNTGADAAVYLQITRGGYTIGDWFVSYLVGESSTYSVAAHEGWHQYVARHFKGRLPPFLEEGTACMFENVRFPSELPRWDLSVNPNRTLGLRKAVERNRLWPLEKLVAMHAGDVVRLPGDRIEAFYSQNWAFARFLWEYNEGEYRPAFKRLLADTAAGTLKGAAGGLRAGSGWSPSSVKPMLEHYLGKSLDQIETEFQDFMRTIAFEQFGRQWSARP